MRHNNLNKYIHIKMTTHYFTVSCSLNSWKNINLLLLLLLLFLAYIPKCENYYLHSNFPPHLPLCTAMFQVNRCTAHASNSPFSLYFLHPDLFHSPLFKVSRVKIESWRVCRVQMTGDLRDFLRSKSGGEKWRGYLCLTEVKSSSQRPLLPPH